MDEHDILQEGEVSVSNGAVMGEVLLCCCSHFLWPKDVLRATAVVQIEGGSVPSYKDCLVFSARRRKLPSDLFLEGAKYHVVHKLEVVRAFCATDLRDHSVCWDFVSTSLPLCSYFLLRIDRPGTLEILEKRRRQRRSW
uniref:Uncharacterized protein n=1 Tax=Corethron hystrix TaxID=216773 RepID=A0A7S1BP73_9STRA